MQFLHHAIDARNRNDVDAGERSVDLASVLLGQQDATHARLARRVKFLDHAADAANLSLDREFAR